MKRYRVLQFDFDTRASLLSLVIKDDWDESVKQSHRENKAAIQEGIVADYGKHNASRKVEDFAELGNSPISVVAFHNRFFRQARTAFIAGAYYPALTGVCALGERVLNQLVLELREDYKGTPEYKKVYRKQSFDNWDLAIDTLERWGVLLPDAADSFRELRDARHKAVHFDPETSDRDRKLALEALLLFSEIVQKQFAAFGPLPWYISSVLGASFVRKESQSEIRRRGTGWPEEIL